VSNCLRRWKMQKMILFCVQILHQKCSFPLRHRRQYCLLHALPLWRVLQSSNHLRPALRGDSGVPRRSYYRGLKTIHLDHLRQSGSRLEVRRGLPLQVLPTRRLRIVRVLLRSQIFLGRESNLCGESFRRTPPRHSL
jgi:hypothetical protein